MTVMRSGNIELSAEVTARTGWFHCVVPQDVRCHKLHRGLGHIFHLQGCLCIPNFPSIQVAPSEIEEVIYTHPSIAKVCVVPVEDDDAGEIPLACVILKEGQTATVEEIIELVEGFVLVL